jgi:hypothetical protein
VLVVAPVLGVIALLAGRGDTALPVFVIVGPGAVLALASRVRRRLRT